MKCLYILDCVSPFIQFNYQNEKSKKSCSGGFISIWVICFIIYSFFYFSEDLIYRTNPYSQFSKRFVKNSNFFKNDLKFGFLITDKNGVKLTKELENQIDFNYIFNEIQNNETNISYCKSIFSSTIRKCNEDKDFANSKNLFLKKKDEISIDDLYCINTYYNQNSTPINVSTRNPLTEICRSSISSYYFSLNRCTNDSKNSTCSSKVSNLFHEEIYISIYFIDNIINLNHYSKPNNGYIYSYTQSLLPQISKTTKLIFKNSKLFTDDNIIVKKFYSKNFTQLDYISNEIDSDKKRIFKLFFEYSEYEDVYHRKYLKIQDVMGKLGGVINSLILLSTCIIRFYAEKNFLISIANEIFDSPINNNSKISEKETSILNKIQKADLVVKAKNIYDNKNKVNFEFIKDRGILKLKQQPANYNILIQMSFNDYIKSIFKCKSNYKKIEYFKISQFIESRLNVSYIINSLWKLEKLSDSIKESNVNINKKEFTNKLNLSLIDERLDATFKRSKIFNDSDLHLNI